MYSPRTAAPSSIGITHSHFILCGLSETALPQSPIKNSTSNISPPSPALVILVGLLLWAFASQLLAALSWGHDSYQLTEWLINYAGGFVRRGLPGWLPVSEWYLLLFGVSACWNIHSFLTASPLARLIDNIWHGF
jgi:hypothetical protein